jgi:hypothetical protein
MKPNQIIVLTTEGKHESVDYASVIIFQTIEDAIVFCNNFCTGKTKHWKHAEIVQDNERIELQQPEQ